MTKHTKPPIESRRHEADLPTTVTHAEDLGFEHLVLPMEPDEDHPIKARKTAEAPAPPTRQVVDSLGIPVPAVSPREAFAPGKAPQDRAKR